MRTSHCTHGIVLLLALSAAPLHAAAIEVEPDDLQPGLVAHYRSLGDSRATLDRVEAKPAFHLGHSSPHPRLPPGPFEVVWTGVLTLQDPAPVSFDAFVSGEVTLEVDGTLVLEGRGQKETDGVRCKAALERPPGLYRITIRYRSRAGTPARLQIGWQGPAFSREPLPAWRLGHLADQRTPALGQEERIDQGRTAVGRFGCARCHQEAFPGVSEPAPGPALNDVKGRLRRAWLLDWLEDPARLRTGARMPALFAPGRKGFVERWLVAEHLLGPSATEESPARASGGNHRFGRRAFISVGCAACHYLPDMARAEQPDLGQVPLSDLSPRLPATALAAFLGNPKTRYPDGRCPPLPLSDDMARDIAAYLLLGAKSAKAGTVEPPSAAEIREVSERLGAHGTAATAAALVREKRCAACHPGLEGGRPADIHFTASKSRGCLSQQPTGTTPRFTLDARTRKALAAYRDVAAREKHPAPFVDRQRRLERAGCVRCHQRDNDRPPPIEAIGSKLGGAWLQALPFQRTPRLTFPHQKFLRSHLLAAVRSGISGLRPASYSYRMPAYGDEADALVQALAEGDGDLPAGPEPVQTRVPDPTLGPLAGPRLVGFQGYGCVSCHVWNGKMLSEPDPGAVGTDLTRVVGRIRRDWLDRYLEGPGRVHPNTPMPTIFPKGQPAPLQTVLDGDPGKQKDALWSYFALGKDAPSPKPPPPLPVDSPRPGEPPLVAQVPVHLPDGKVVESLCLLTADHDLIVYDVGSGALHAAYTGAQILRDVHGRLRSFSVSGTPVEKGFRAGPPLQLAGPGKPETPSGWTFHGYDRLPDGVRIRAEVQLPAGKVEIAETLRITTTHGKRSLSRDVQLAVIAAARSVLPASLRLDLPAAKVPASVERVPLIDAGKIEGTLERPGYRAIAYPRPRTISGEDRVMPGAVAVNPRDGRVFVASMKTGELFVLRDPGDDGRHARFDNYARGLFEEAFSMHAESDALYVLHRRNLTRIVEGRDGLGERFDRVAALPHGIAGTYDYAYGLARDRGGAFFLSYAPYANQHLPGSGGAVRLVPGRKPEEVAFGFRNPLGWCSGPEGEVFFTDNQGEWVATNKLCHLVKGRFYGFPNPTQKQHASLPVGKTAVWVPYGWAKSINGVAYDSSEGKFGPFAGQLFLAELMFGGAIVRASLEKVNGEYQGACFPFWGPGLLGPLTLAFDPRGRLWVGGITEPGWMAQPDRGALFRIDFTGHAPFEMKSIHVLPHGFRIVFTKPVAPATARDPASYRVEHYRYEYTGAYGSPELDRTPTAIERVEVSEDGRQVDLTLPPLVKDRVYLIRAGGVRSAKGERLVHPTGAYTLNEIPSRR